ncbi:MAG: hypothetical protein M3P83_02030 [Actinomycetota bacterium]|nr:hypothetical protein [Actinomycetota bacterium]
MVLSSKENAMNRRLSIVALPTGALVVAAVLYAAAAPPAVSAASHVVAEGTFSSSGPAWTYDPIVPIRASAVVRTIETDSGQMVATLQVRDFAGAVDFTVHAHTGSCGPNPLASGGHYQHEVGGAVDAANELWLGFSTTPSGTGSAQSVVDWHFRPGGARSITFHDPDRSGLRVACLPVSF